MADIDAYLKNILTAVYGEEVRGSIHDAIKAINETGAGDVKPNTKDNAGIVQKGDGNEDSLWATDSDGNPSWVKKDDVATKVKTNSKTADGIVTKGQYSPDKVWATDGEGNPAWREIENGIRPNIILDTSDWDSSKYSGQYLRYFAEIEFSNDILNQSANSTVTEGLKFDVFSTMEHLGGSETSINVTFSLFERRLSGYVDFYESNSNTFNKKEENSPRDKYINKIFLIVDMTYPKAYLTLEYYGNAKIYINNLSITGGIQNFTWIYDKKNYIDRTTVSSNMFVTNTLKASYDGLATSKKDGVVPKIPTDASSQNYILGVTTEGTVTKASWQTVSSLGFQTSAQVQEAISAAIASADFSSFEIVGSIPEPETAVENKFYLVKNEDTQHYDIYAKIGEQIEWIDDTTVDLTDYATKEELPTNVSELANDANYTSLTEEQYNTLLQLLGEE